MKGHHASALKAKAGAEPEDVTHPVLQVGSVALKQPKPVPALARDASVRGLNGVGGIKGAALEQLGFGTVGSLADAVTETAGVARLTEAEGETDFTASAASKSDLLSFGEQACVELKGRCQACYGGCVAKGMVRRRRGVEQLCP